ncbi:hypothetical protein DM02DRAFT_368172 [Periconia macrospinosa]|uniref:Uncharacterized protein n=1 Tax=Periconia macrospinosa TaxID=97972 RepID=A0A2V1CZE0_9PLEO|nr:hypothetical protein DM02DRAFT_368172 [Periconia macrospinosa]
MPVAWSRDTRAKDQYAEYIWNTCTGYPRADVRSTSGGIHVRSTLVLLTCIVSGMYPYLGNRTVGVAYSI